MDLNGKYFKKSKNSSQGIQITFNMDTFGICLKKLPRIPSMCEPTAWVPPANLMHCEKDRNLNKFLDKSWLTVNYSVFFSQNTDCILFQSTDHLIKCWKKVTANVSSVSFCKRRCHPPTFMSNSHEHPSVSSGVHCL